MKKIYSGLLAVMILFLAATVSHGFGDSAVWLGTDLEYAARRMGYFHEDQVLTKILSQHWQGEFSSEIQIGSTMVRFNNQAGLYAMVGAKINGRFDFAFGGGFKLHDRYSPLMISAGMKCLVPSKEVLYEIECFYQFLEPLLLNVSYDSYTQTLFLGIGLSYN